MSRGFCKIQKTKELHEKWLSDTFRYGTADIESFVQVLLFSYGGDSIGNVYDLDGERNGNGKIVYGAGTRFHATVLDFTFSEKVKSSER